MALFAEAEPVIRSLYLRKNTKCKEFSIYENGEISLCISGTGKINSAIAVTYSAFLYRANSEHTAFLNLGVCGSKKTEANIGELFLINKIEDIGSGRTYYPDILTDWKLREKSIHCSDQPFYASDKNTSISLVDMESSGFCRAASLLAPPQDIQLLKIVSDHFDSERVQINAKFISALIENRIPELKNFLDVFPFTSDKKQTSLSPDDIDTIRAISENLKLTTTQKIQLVNSVKSFRVRFQTELSFPPELISRTSSKHESKRVFSELMKHLAKKPASFL
ncbi:MAG: hypothetical protein K8R21_02960 [Leptospira sp.]|nr:hypothetical protein [Leptospira sp.]